MAKLHEVLAVESGLQTTAKKINAETIRTFEKKDEHFLGMTSRTEHFAEDDKKLDLVETKQMVTTVLDKLIYNTLPNVKAFDAYLQKEATNQKAVADLVVDDKTLATNVPGTVLLGLETKLVDLRAVYEAIPTLAPGPTWELDRTVRDKGGVYKEAIPSVSFRTRKTVKPIVMSPATEHHPAQIQAVTEDVPIAKITKQQSSGMITPSQKSDLLEKIDKLLRGVKRARQRANATEVVPGKIGAVIFDFIHEGIVE